jgi:YD repeat-containing protein
MYAYSYDAEGNLATRSIFGEFVSYGYDNRNRLTSVTTRDSDGGTVVEQVDYTYDALDRRIEKVVDPDGSSGSAAVTTEKYTYDGDNLYLRFDGANSLTDRYVSGPGADEAYLDIGTSGSRWLLTDHEGSVRDVVDNQGTVTVHKAYDSFGQVIKSQIAPAAADAMQKGSGFIFQ